MDLDAALDRRWLYCPDGVVPHQFSIASQSGTDRHRTGRLGRDHRRAPGDACLAGDSCRVSPGLDYRHAEFVHAVRTAREGYGHHRPRSILCGVHPEHIGIDPFTARRRILGILRRSRHLGSRYRCLLCRHTLREASARAVDQSQENDRRRLRRPRTRHGG